MVLGSEIIYITSLTSTNSYANKLAASRRPPEGTIVRTDYQTAGKGQPGNKWESEAGKNLLFSLVLYPSWIKPEDQFLVSMAISLAIHDHLSSILSACSIKWPNDIYVNNDKIAGILIESSITGETVSYMIAGIGLNVNQKIFAEAPKATSVSLVTGKDHDTNEFFSSLIKHLDKRYNSLKEDKSEELKEEYLEKLYLYRQWSSFREGMRTFTGRIISAGNDGALIIEHQNGRKKKYYFKEVEYV